MKGQVMKKLTNNGGGFKWEFRNCTVCGKRFIAKNYNSIRCFECQAKHKAQKERERVQRIRDEKNKGKDSLHICNKIKSCKYGVRVGGVDVCDYLAQEKKRRPCPAGEYTVYETRTTVRWWEGGVSNEAD